MNINQILGNPKDRWDELLVRGFSFEILPTTKKYVGLTMRTPNDEFAGVVISVPVVLGQEQVSELLLETCERYAEYYEIFNLDGMVN